MRVAARSRPRPAVTAWPHRSAKGLKVMTGITPTTGNSIAPRQRGSRAGRGLLASARGLALVGVALAEAGLIVALALELSFAVLVYRCC